MAYWLVKTEPETWSWKNQLESHTTFWDGVRNYQACNNMKAMQIGDLAFFYHSGKERQIVGIVKVINTYTLDPTDDSNRFGMVEVETFATFEKVVTLAEIKKNVKLSHLSLVRQSRLSVMPIDPESWDIIYQQSLQ